MTSPHINAYYDLERAANIVREGGHRGFIGGMWDEIGRLQLDFLVGQGLEPDMRLLDIGCGCLRGGVNFVGYLDPGHYYGIDISQQLIDAGYDVELAAAGLKERMPRENLNANGDFDAAMFGTTFDMAIAQSVFTHLPMNHLRLCMIQTARWMKPGGRFFATVFVADDLDAWSKPILQPPAGFVTHPERDPFHYRHADMAFCIDGLPWELEAIRDWGHPRGQQMAVFRRLGAGSDTEATDGPAASHPRSLDREAAKSLRIGAMHYSSYVGPSDQWDLMGAMQFRLLTTLGLRESHNLLDVGCGSLRSGRLMLSYLNPGRYFGIEPNRWLIDDFVQAEVGQDFIDHRKPTFLNDSSFDFRLFGVTFDYVIAQSIFSHAGPDMLRAALSSIRDTLDEQGLVLATFIHAADQPGMAVETDGWTYPACITYHPETLRELVSAAGLWCRELPWFHPRQVWYAIARSQEALPPPEADVHLSGAVINVAEFARSLVPKASRPVV